MAIFTLDPDIQPHRINAHVASSQASMQSRPPSNSRHPLTPVQPPGRLTPSAPFRGTEDGERIFMYAHHIKLDVSVSVARHAQQFAS